MSKKNQSKILDNHSGQTVGGKLLEEIEENSKLRFASAFFTIHAYAKLRNKLYAISNLKFLFGSPGSVDDLDPDKKTEKAFMLKDQNLHLSQVMQQKAIAKDCKEWAENNNIQIRTIKQKSFMHGKMYHIEKPNGQSTLITGSSNFTSKGFGFNQSGNMELNLLAEDTETCAELAQWFDDIWKNKNLVSDAKEDFLNALERLGAEYAPEFIYYKTLFHIFENEIDQGIEGGKLEEAHLYDTEIWKALYPFQKHGVKGAINKLQQHNGCIIADSVGLGKTYEALAVIKFFQSRKENVLVLCPKKLEDNWKAYSHQFHQTNNPFEKDRIDYAVLAHTDLTRDTGMANRINLANINWGKFGLVVIDESHNFRNESKNRLDEEGNIVRFSRYQKLLEDVIGSGSRRAKVLMLSATPVNNSLRDLRNQIYLMTESRGEGLSRSLGIQDITTLLGVAQRRFEEWQKQGGKNKHDLVDHLGGEFFTLLNGVTIARGRRHVEQYYGDFIKKSGGFPKREKPQNKRPPTDDQGTVSYDDLHDRISSFSLAIYNPTEYLNNQEKIEALKKEKKRFNFNQEDREHWLIGMMRTNFLKRLESSVDAFCKTLARTIEKIEDIENKIEKYTASQKNGEIDTSPETDEEDDEFIVTRLEYHLRDLDHQRWKEDLSKDREVLQRILNEVMQITPTRDAKLIELKRTILDKIQNPTLNKQGKINRKVLIFTSFADTARYLHEHLKDDIRQEDIHVAQLSGGSGNQTSLGSTNFGDILDNFSPIARNRGNSSKDEIDILIATDCISEGQNLQDCDTVINYDIHWNPVRLIQRFGRIDRIGSQNKSVHMINFWPTDDLDKYLDLKNRVETRMQLADITATGVENLLEDSKRNVEFRNEQLKKLQHEAIDPDEDLSLSDFTLNDFMAELLDYLQGNKKRLEEAPDGIYAIASLTANKNQKDFFLRHIKPGVIFFLKQRNAPKEKLSHIPIHPYYLIYIDNDGEVRGSVSSVKKTLDDFGSLARRQKTIQDLCDEFDRETNRGQNMDKYNQLLKKGLSHIQTVFEKKEASALTQDRKAILTKTSERPRSADDFELITWLVIKD